MSSSDEEPSELQIEGASDSETGSDLSGDAENSTSDSEGAPDRAQDALASVPFEQRARLLADGSSSRRAAHAQAGPGSAPAAAKRRREAAAQAEAPAKRANKNAPVEMKISRRPVDVLRDAVQKKGRHSRDPRFVDTAQTRPSDAIAARKRYAFVFDQRIPQEVRELRTLLKKEKDSLARQRLQQRISRLQQAIKYESDKRIEDEVETEWKQKEKAAVAAGKNPYYLKKSEKRKLILSKKYEKLEASGQLDKYMLKRRKRNAAKDHKKMPETGPPRR